MLGVMPGASEMTRRVKTINANWTAGEDGDDGRFGVLIITEDDEQHVVAPSAAAMTMVALLRPNRIDVGSFRPHGVIVAGIVGKMPWTEAWSRRRRPPDSRKVLNPSNRANRPALENPIRSRPATASWATMSEQRSGKWIPDGDQVGFELRLAVRAGDVEALQRLLRSDPALATARLGGRGGGSETALHVVTGWPGLRPQRPRDRAPPDRRWRRPNATATSHDSQPGPGSEDAAALRS